MEWLKSQKTYYIRIKALAIVASAFCGYEALNFVLCSVSFDA